jgi:hypothetical protein
VGFDVENIRHFVWPEKHIDPMSTLILGESDKDVIKALARKYSKGKDKWGADFIKGKGEGQIFLLHGEPLSRTFSSMKTDNFQAHLVQVRPIQWVSKSSLYLKEIRTTNMIPQNAWPSLLDDHCFVSL